MEFPFKVIESKIANRNQFEMVEGHQPTHALLYLKEGRFTVEVGGRKETVHAGDCVILPDYIHFRRNVEQPIVFVYIKFGANPHCPYTLPLPNGKVEFQDRPRFLADISLLESLMESETLLAAGYREHLLMDILFQISHTQGVIGGTEEPCHDPLVAAAMNYITRRLDEKIAIEEVCRAAGTNPSTLNFRFRRERGCSIGRFITEERMKKARHLLRSSSYSLAEIARRCGYENGYYFSNAFKKHHGIPPSAYRK